MENPYQEHGNPSYAPQFDPQPFPPVFQGNNTMATLSLVMGILSLLSLCCMPPAIFLFSGLGILFSCLSKGQYTRPGSAKAGMAICVSCIALLSTLVITVCVLFFVTEKGQSFMRDYMALITSENLSEEELYEFLYKYIYGNENFQEDGSLLEDYYNQDRNYEDYDQYHQFEEFFGDDFPYFYQQPDESPHSGGSGNFI